MGGEELAFRDPFDVEAIISLGGDLGGDPLELLPETGQVTAVVGVDGFAEQ